MEQQEKGNGRPQLSYGTQPQDIVAQLTVFTIALQKAIYVFRAGRTKQFILWEMIRPQIGPN